MQVTIFENIFSKKPFYIPVKDALGRIFDGRSKTLVNEIRGTLDKSKSQKLKSNLPSVCFSGKFGVDRKDEQIIEHSGFIVLDFDDVFNLREKRKSIQTIPHTPDLSRRRLVVNLVDGASNIGKRRFFYFIFFIFCPFLFCVAHFYDVAF